MACVHRGPASRQAARPPFAPPSPVPAPKAAPRVACFFDLPAPVASIADVPSPLLAHAVLPSLDPATMIARVERLPARDGRGDAAVDTRDCDSMDCGIVPERDVVDDCHGGRSIATWEGDDPKTPRPRGKVEILGRRALPGGREALWIGTGKELHACVGEQSVLAIVALDGPRVAVLGVAPWVPRGCSHPREGLHAETVGGETVYVAPDRFGSGAGYNGWDDVWTLRDGELRQAGRYVTLETRPHDGMEPVDADGLYRPELSATARFVDGAIVLDGETTWERPVKGDAGAGPSSVLARRLTWVRRFGLRDGELVEEQPLPAAR